MSRFKVHQLFNSSQNAQFVCPYCEHGEKRKVGFILKENLIIGNTEQLDYKDLFKYYEEDYLQQTPNGPGGKKKGELLQIDSSEIATKE